MKTIDLGIGARLKPVTPVIATLPKQRMVTVSVKGDPNVESSRVLPPLYASAYGIRKAWKEAGTLFKVDKLRGRWPGVNPSTDKSSWRGKYALPLPDATDSIPPIAKAKQLDGVIIALDWWEYGVVGMILHIGPYTDEPATIALLMTHIAINDYSSIADSHEEVYITDPSKTDPAKMKTIILYRLVKEE